MPIYTLCDKSANYAIGDNGDVISLWKGWKVLRPFVSGNYAKIEIAGKHEPIHHLVLTAFVQARPDGMVANHKDGNKLNNAADNLEWVTPSYNTAHAYQTGLAKQVGVGNNQAKLTDGQILEVLRRRELGESGSSLAREYGGSRRAIRKWVTGENRMKYMKGDEK